VWHSQAFKGDAGIAAITFRATTRWKEGSTSGAEISSFTHAGEQREHSRTHVLTGCEPAVLLGRDTGPNAVELVLVALDLRNFVGVEAGPRPGFTEIWVKTSVKSSNASEEQLQELSRYVQDTSPVKDIIASPVPVTTSLQVIS